MAEESVSHSDLRRAIDRAVEALKRDLRDFIDSTDRRMRRLEEGAAEARGGATVESRRLARLEARVDELFSVPPTSSQDTHPPVLTADDVKRLISEQSQPVPVEIAQPVEVVRWWSEWRGIAGVSAVALALGAGLSGGVTALVEIVRALKDAAP